MADEPAGVAQLASGSLDEAEPLSREAYDVGLQLLGPDHPDVLAYEMNLANLFRARGALHGR